MSGASVTVRIAGESYTLRTHDEPGHLEEAARLVDGRMREIAATGKVASGARLAVLAALHFADELARARRETRTQDEAAEGRIARLVETLDRALSPPASEG